MCGIAGFTQFNGIVGDRSILKKMGHVISHRGPDAEGDYLEDDIGLCHRRLSIIDLSSAGNQPMSSNNGDYIIVFNGEIYNFSELRKEAEYKGYIFRTKTDTEVILAMYQYEGLDCLEKLNGMFAFALWDRNKKKLYLARDRIGKKPLYYYYDDKDFVFASEIKAILQVPGIPREIRYDAIYDYFTYQYIPDPKTIYNNIYKLKPGYWMEVNSEGVKKKQYWDVSFKNQSTKKESTISEELYEVLDKSVRRRMISDVPLGAFLSGGVDSSAIVALMANNNSNPVITCSIGFDSKEFDEVKYAQIIANKYNTVHHEFTVQDNIKENLEYIASFFDEPFADPSFVPTYFVSKLARQKVKVALAGDGGDENFAGYQKYTIDRIENRLRSLFPKSIRTSIFPLIAQAIAQNNNKYLRKAFTLLNALSMEPDYGFFLTNSFFEKGLWQRLINDDFRTKLSDYNPASVTKDYYHKADTVDHLSKILYTDMKTYLPGDVLVKVDRMSMANSLEVRAPILDYQVVNYVSAIPHNLKFKNNEKKYILKKCFDEILPHDILYRKKMGFSVPLAYWLRNELRPLAESYLFNSNSGLTHFFKMDEVKLIWEDHLNGIRDYSSELWSLLMFSMWWKNYMDDFNCHA